MSPSSKLRVGIFLPDINNVRNDHWYLIHQVIKHQSCQVCVVMHGESDSEGKLSSIYNWDKKNGTRLKKWLFLIQLKVESLLFKEWKAVKREEVLAEISGIEKISLAIGKMENSTGLEKVTALDLDVIIAADNIECPPDLFKAARKGVWQLQFGENLKKGSGPSNFSEIVTRKRFCTVSLVQLLNSETQYVVNKGYFNRDWSFLKNFYDVRLASLSLITKSLNDIISGRSTSTLTHDLSRPALPDSKYFIKYLLNFYLMLVRMSLCPVWYKLFRIRKECWALFLAKGDFFELKTLKLTSQKMPRNEFWADPFLFSWKGIPYIFFENYSYDSKLGKISVGRITDDQIVDVRDVLVKNHHLSYPQIVEEDGELYLIPETAKAGRIEVYRCKEFPWSWELFSTKFEGEYIVDTTYFQDVNGDRWLFMNKGGSINAELHIFKIDSLKLGKVIPHALNPVYIDCRKARNAGSVFKYGNDYYRPNQRNIDGIYGRELAMNKIKTLTLNEYEEEIIRIVQPNFHKGLQAVHTFNQIPGLFIVDGCYTFKL